MITAECHCFAFVKAVCGLALDATIEMQLFAAAALRFDSEPIEERFSKPLRALRFVCHQVIDVKKAAPGKTGTDPITRDGHHPVTLFHVRDTVSLMHLFLHA